MTYTHEPHQENPFPASTPADQGDALAEVERRIERLREVADRWGQPGGSRRLSRRATDKADGMETALRIVREVRAAATPTETPPASCKACHGKGSRIHGWAMCPAPCRDCDGTGTTPPADRATGSAVCHGCRRGGRTQHADVCPENDHDTGEGETTAEWSWRYPDRPTPHHWYSEADARRWASNYPHHRGSGVLVRRERTTYPDRVTDWQEVPADE